MLSSLNIIRQCNNIIVDNMIVINNCNTCVMATDQDKKHPTRQSIEFTQKRFIIMLISAFLIFFQHNMIIIDNTIVNNYYRQIIATDQDKWSTIQIHSLVH